MNDDMKPDNKEKKEIPQGHMVTSVSKKSLEKICQDSLRLLLEIDTSAPMMFEEI
ncbi:hypothetical protein [Yersinia ruckeri]|uniref:hypothetical protein n=1 Tax=Yersinia ruckeri TaxID=29486 RepID=UPI002237C45A|nr:hypothetical protein [Yersinia ruckeri]MCW6598843.1 hypothetical protein [Yersinia ruckeri]